MEIAPPAVERRFGGALSVTSPTAQPSTSDAGPDPIRVAFVMHVMQVAGAEILVAETIRRLGARIDPVVFCLDSVGPLGQDLLAHGTPVFAFGRRPGRDWRLATRLARALVDRRVQVVHAHQYTPFFYSALARVAAGGGPRVIFTEHGRHFPDTVGRMRRWSNRWVLSRLATETNAVCGFSARALQSIDGFSRTKVDVIENGIDLDRYHRPVDVASAKRHVKLSEGRRYIATVARFHPVKDHRDASRCIWDCCGGSSGRRSPAGWRWAPPPGLGTTRRATRVARSRAVPRCSFRRLRPPWGSRRLLFDVSERSGVTHAARGHGVITTSCRDGRRRQSRDCAAGRRRSLGPAWRRTGDRDRDPPHPQGSLRGEATGTGRPGSRSRDLQLESYG